jgi:hypothetical protein
MRYGSLLVGCLLLAGDLGGQTILSTSFEEEGEPGEPSGWVFRQARGECSGLWDDSEAASGERSLRLSIRQDATARAHWAFRERLPLEPDTTYRLSFKMLVAEVEGEAYVIGYENGGQDPEHWHDSPHVKGTEDWREYVVDFRSRPDAEWLQLVCKLRHGTGYAWFDDLKLEQVALPDEPAAPQMRVVPKDDGFGLQAMWTPAQWCRGNRVHLVRGHLNPLSLFFWGDKTAVEEPAIVVELTEGLTLRGPVVRGRGPMPEDIRAEREAVEHDGQPFGRWRLPIPEEPLVKGLHDTPHWESYHHVYVHVAQGAPGEGSLRWWLQTGGMDGPVHELPVTVSAEEPAKLVPPDDFRIYVQHTGALRHPDPAVRQRLVEYLGSAGIVGGLGMTFYEPEKVEVDRQYRELGFALHTWRFDAYQGAAPEEHRVVDIEGERSTSKVCPQFQIERVQPWCENVREYYRAKLASGLKRLIIDYEPPVWDVCFCERCRAAFAERFGLPADECATLPPEELTAKYAKEWGRFRAEQNGAIVKLHCELIHQIDPEVEVGLCSWNGAEWTAGRGGDIALFEPAAAFHAPMIYTAGTLFHDLVEETCNRTRAPVVPFIELSDISQPRSLTPEQLRMNLLATGLSGGAGGFMWVGIECLDAGYMSAIARSVREIAALRERVPLTREAPDWLTVEPVAERSRTIEVDDREIALISPNPAPYVRTHVWGSAGAAMVAFLNYSEGDPFRMAVKGTRGGTAGYRLLDALTGRQLPGDRGELWSREALERGATIEVPPQGLAAVAAAVVE